MVVLRAGGGDGLETWFKAGSRGGTQRGQLPPRQMQLVDSLMRIAWARNPFLYTDLEFAHLPPGEPRDPERAGFGAYASRRFASAERLFAVALHKHPGDVGLRVYPARALFSLQRSDRPG